MPHITVKMISGRSREDKQRLAERISIAVMNTLGASEDSISVAIEDVAADDWFSQVYDPEIDGVRTTLFKKPGYRRF